MSTPRDDTPTDGAAAPGRGSRAHIIGMILCCIPMVVAVIWIFASR